MRLADWKRTGNADRILTTHRARIEANHHARQLLETYSRQVAAFLDTPRRHRTMTIAELAAQLDVSPQSMYQIAARYHEREAAARDA